MELRAFCLHPGMGTTKTLRVMRLTAFLLLVTALQVTARGYSQKVTLSEDKTPLSKVLEVLHQQTGYEFVYQNALMEKAIPVTIHIKDGSLEQALEECFRDQPLSYRIFQGTVAIREKEASISLPVATPPAPPADIHGRVSDSANNALAGASVTVKGTKMTVLTDESGSFILHGITGETTLLISYIGYEPRTIKVTIKDYSAISVVLKRNNSPLDELQIVAYGTATQRFAVGSMATVTDKDIERQPVSNVLLALQGQIPGLEINATSGVPGAQVKVQVRGQNTLSSNPGFISPYDQPLFIIDGVPFAPQNQNLDNLPSFVSSNGIPSGYSPFNSLNPADIESISVLKDANATSIYGTQGANGVILITTKKGKPGKTKLDISANTSVNINASSVKLLNTQQYLQLRKEAIQNDDIDLTSPGSNTSYPDLLVFDQNKYTDFYHTILGKSSRNNDVHIQLSGGSVNNTFILSGGFTRYDYNFPGNYADQRLTLHTNFHHMSLDSRLTIDFGTDVSYDRNNSSGSGGVSKILLPPNTPDLLSPSGQIVWNYNDIDLSNYQYYGYLKQPALLNVYNLNNSLRVSYKIVQGLNAGVNIGYSRNNSTQQVEQPMASQPPAYAIASASFSNSTYQTVNIEPQMDFERTMGKSALSVLVGGTYKKNLSYSSTSTGSGYTSDYLLGSIDGAAHVVTSDNSIIYKYTGAFARIKYIYAQKYIFNLTTNRDGSSNFGPGRQFGDFGSAGAAWIFSEEKGFKTSLPFISFAKLSANYGTSGSDGIAPYQYQPFWQTSPLLPVFEGFRPYVPYNLNNPDYSWALKKSLNTALDLGFFKDRLLLNVTWYRDREDNQLVNYQLPGQSGLPTVLQNLNALVQNQGWEFTITSTNIKSSKFNWATNFNISFNRNKLLAFPGLENSSYATLYTIGKPTNEVLGYRYKGVDSATGVFMFYTAKGAVTGSPVFALPSQGGDLVPIASAEPKYYGGLGNNLSYGPVSLFVFFQFSKRTAPNYLHTVYNYSYVPGALSNVPVEALNHWKKAGDVSSLEQVTAVQYSTAFNAASYFIQSAGAYSDDTYVRLKTLALAYNFPDKNLQKLHIKNGSIFIRCQNLLTFSNVKVGDPEQPGEYDSFPLQRTFAGGLSFNF